jgi:hypothetical protein
VINMNQYINSEYVKKSNALVGASDLMVLVNSTHLFIHQGLGVVRGSTRNISSMRV